MRTRHGNALLTCVAAVLLSICVFPYAGFAQSQPGPLYANEPKIEFPAVAIAQCLAGRVAVRYRLVDEVPTDIEILESAPGDLYVAAVKRWLIEWHSWRVRVGAYVGEFVSGHSIEKTYRFEPCER